MWRGGVMLSLFSVETLDTRFAASEDRKKRDRILAKSCPARWVTQEFWFYWLCFAVCVPLMIKAPIDVSLPSNINYPKYSDLLSDGWMGRPVDNSDSQYSSFRDIFPLLALLVVVHQTLRRSVGSWANNAIVFDCLFGVLLITILHGISVVKILAILLVNYKLSEENSFLMVWIFGVGTLFSNELLEGYQFSAISSTLAFLDGLGGVMPRWEILFKCTMLRMLSFSMDRILARRRIKLIEGDGEFARVANPLSKDDYNFVTYIGYCLYAPLYVAGPILTFNDYVRQRNQPLESIESKRTIRYGIRFVVCLLTMELILHFCYIQAITKTRAWEGDSAAQISMIALFNLVVIWLKLLIPWRFFRLWALIDKVDPPENMIRCVADNYSTMAFWRSWHRSFNRWVIRYLYVPLGGSNRPLVNSAFVFTFVAIWHDINPRLLVWSWLIILFVTPEMVATKLFSARKYGNRWWYRHLCAVGAVINIWMMMIANLVGFAVGVDGIKDMLYDMTHTTNGIIYSVFASCMLFVGAQVMFEVREREHRAGIDLKC